LSDEYELRQIGPTYRSAPTGWTDGENTGTLNFDKLLAGEPAIDAAVLDPVMVKLRTAYDIGWRTDRYEAEGRKEIITLHTGDAHHHVMGMSHAFEQLVALVTRRRWLNEHQTGAPDWGEDVEGLNVRWRAPKGANPLIHPQRNGKPPLKFPIVYGTGPTLEDLAVLGWLDPYKVCVPANWQEDLPKPAWEWTQGCLPLFTLPAAGSPPPWSG